MCSDHGGISAQAAISPLCREKSPYSLVTWRAAQSAGFSSSDLCPGLPHAALLPWPSPSSHPYLESIPTAPGWPLILFGSPNVPPSRALWKTLLHTSSYISDHVLESLSRVATHGSSLNLFPKVYNLRPHFLFTAWPPARNC